MIHFMLIAILGWMMGAVINYLSDVLPAYRKIIAPTARPASGAFQSGIICSATALSKMCQARTKRVWIVETGSVLITLVMVQPFAVTRICSRVSPGIIWEQCLLSISSII
jgi:hypothetical protein